MKPIKQNKTKQYNKTIYKESVREIETRSNQDLYKRLNNFQNYQYFSHRERKFIQLALKTQLKSV